MHFWQKLLAEQIFYKIVKFPLNHSKIYFPFLTKYIVLKYMFFVTLLVCNTET